MLQQKDTWNKIQISLQGFSALLRHFDVFDDFWPVVEGFGLKFGPEDENHMSCAAQLREEKPA